MKPHRPYGAAPTRLEAEILKLRAFEMLLVLFYVEDLKKSILSTFEISRRVKEDFPELPGKNKLQAAQKILIADGVISQQDSELFLRLINYRNIIGHELHALTCDIGAYSELGDHDPDTLEPIVKYDDRAARQAAKLRADVKREMSRKYASVISFAGLRFEAAEKIYLGEINRLIKKVNASIDRHNKLLEKARLSLLEGAAIIEEVQPGHPKNFKANGSLSDKGVSCIRQLFEFGANPLAVSYLMRISLNSVRRRFKEWQESPDSKDTGSD